MASVAKPPYYIYEIVGRKVGCTNDLELRLKTYEKVDGSRPIIRIREQIPYKLGEQFAGDREWIWANVLGYPRGSHYTTRSGFKTGAAGRAGSGRAGGLRSMANKTPEQRSELARKAGLISGRRNTRARLAEIGKIGGLKGSRRINELGLGGAQRDAVCPYCGKEGKLLNLHRYHFNNCRNKLGES